MSCGIVRAAMARSTASSSVSVPAAVQKLVNPTVAAFVIPKEKSLIVAASPAVRVPVNPNDTRLEAAGTAVHCRELKKSDALSPVSRPTDAEAPT